MLTNADLSRVLDPQKYPPKRYPYLTELIETFQLGFPISSCGPKRFLIPGLLRCCYFPDLTEKAW
ncbi:MAG: hypothetical protein AAFY72_04415 [Cyanobacteria bacterium J06649_4]